MHFSYSLTRAIFSSSNMEIEYEIRFHSVNVAPALAPGAVYANTTLDRRTVRAAGE